MIVSAKASEIPDNIYYIDNDLYAYLENDKKIMDLLNSDENKIYIQYRIIDETNETDLDLIELKSDKNRYLILSNEDEKFNDNIEIKARYVIYNNDYVYYEWSDNGKIYNLDLNNLPVPIISNLNIDSEISYILDNKAAIEEYFIDYNKIYDSKIEYILEYSINNGEWIVGNLPKNININDIKIDFKIKYRVDKIESKYSNILSYEKHPEKTCMFDSDLCCNEFFGISSCIYLLGLFLILILILIYVDKKRQFNREA